MFKINCEVSSLDELSEQNLETIGTGGEIQQLLTQLFPAIRWELRPDSGIIFGSLDGPDTWYEFFLKESADKSFSINTSFRTHTRQLIPEICRALGLVAVDGQTNTLIKGDSKL